MLLTDPAVASVGSTIGVTTGFSAANRGQLTVQLKPFAQRGVTSEQVIARLRGSLGRIPGLSTFLYSAQDLRPGGSTTGSQFQFVLLDQDLTELRSWAARLEDKLRTLPGITDVASDQDKAAPQQNVVIDRGVQIPEGLIVGEEPELDARRFRATEQGVCLITQPMIDGLNL